MTALNRTPQNTNYLQASKYLLTFTRIKDTQYFCQEVNVPGISLGEAVRSTPLLDLYSPGTKLSFNGLNITFTLDEQLLSWKNLYDWLFAIANPNSLADRESNKTYMTDATLTILSALNNPIIRIQFMDVFPTSISDLQFDTKSDADQIITCTANFRYQSYQYLTA
jgi:hypothetical protein